MRTAISVLAALGAAFLFGASSVLQQAAAEREAGAPMLRLALLRRLAHRRTWLVAVGLAAVSFGVQAVALAFGPLVLVQPVAATDLLFALPLLARRHRVRLGPVDWLGGALVVAGVGGFLAVSPPTEGRASPAVGDWVPVLVAVAAVVVVAARAALRARPAFRTGLLAGAAAAVFALVDALTKSVVGLLGAEGPAVLLHWEPYALGAAGLTGLLLGQSAFRSGSLLISLPIIDSLEPVGAVLIGTTVFAERLASSPFLLAGQALAGAVAVVGIVLLDRSPLLARLESSSPPPPPPSPPPPAPSQDEAAAPGQAGPPAG